MELHMNVEFCDLKSLYRSAGQRWKFYESVGPLIDFQLKVYHIFTVVWKIIHLKCTEYL